MGNADFDVVILGGGLVGASLALVLQRQGKQVLLLEKKLPQTDLVALARSWDARIYAISPANQAFLAQQGVWPDERAQPVVRMDVRGDVGGRIVFDAADGRPAWLTHMVENRYLLARIWLALREAGVTVESTEAVAVDSDVFSASLRLVDGRTVSSRVLIGADGAHSWLRTQLNIAVKETPYHHRGVVANFATEYPHQGCAHQWFNRGEVLAYLPLPGKRISIVWSTADAERLLNLSPEELGVAVTAQGDGVLGQLTPETPAFAFDLVLRQPDSVVAQRVALIGDAAHTIHPLAGQGVNLGFGDVQCLAALMAAAPDVGAWSVLKHYRQQRLLPVCAMQQGCHGLFRLFAENRVPGVNYWRNWGLSAVNALTPVKRQLIRQAMGWSV